jgi:mannosyl-3-phosphoglycerate phosphatase
MFDISEGSELAHKTIMRRVATAYAPSHWIAKPSMPQYVMFADLDGTLLNTDPASWEAAAPALRALRARGIPLILVSSKTRAELESLRRHLQHQDPFIVENGAAVFIPQGLFTFPLERARTKASYDVIELGMPYQMLRDVLKQIEDAVETPLHGFGDLSVDDIMQVTGLARPDAELAKVREYDEPFLLEGPRTLVEEVCRQIAARGLHWTKARGLFHLTGVCDKGEAAEVLMRCYQREQRLRFQSRPVESVGIGDSINDIPLLGVVDHPILVQRPDGSFDTEVLLPRLVRARGIGPQGWNDAVLQLLQHSFLGEMGLAG